MNAPRWKVAGWRPLLSLWLVLSSKYLASLNQFCQGTLSTSWHQLGLGSSTSQGSTLSSAQLLLYHILLIMSTLCIGETYIEKDGCLWKGLRYYPFFLSPSYTYTPPRLPLLSPRVSSEARPYCRHPNSKFLIHDLGSAEPGEVPSIIWNTEVWREYYNQVHNRLLALLARGEYLERRQNKSMTVLLVELLLPLQIWSVKSNGCSFRWCHPSSFPI